MWISLHGITTAFELALLIGLFLIHSILLLIKRKPIGRLLINLISLVMSSVVVLLIPEKKLDSWLIVLVLPAALYFGFVFFFQQMKLKKPESPAEKDALSRRKSPTFQLIFYSLLVAYFIFFELASRRVLGKSCVQTLFDFSGDGSLVVIGFWALTTLSWAALASDHVRTLYISANGKIESYIFLGDKLRLGQFVVKEADKERKEIFAPWHVLKNEYPNSSFGSVNRRVYMLEDREFKLTPITNFLPGRILLMSAMQLGLLGINLGLVLFLLGEKMERHAAISVKLLGPVGLYWLIFVLMIYVGGTVFNWINMRGADYGNQLIIPLPVTIVEGAVVKGKVICSDTNTPSGQSANDRITRQEYSIKFDQEAGFDFARYVNWSERKYNANNTSSGGRKFNAGRKAAQRLNQKAFDMMDNAIANQTYVEFKVNEDLCIRPILDEPYAHEK
jgi:hypothetical protein